VVLHSGSVRRRQGGVLVVGAAEPQVPAWLRAAGYPTRAATGADAASAALDEGPADLVVVDRENGGLEVAECCARLREDTRLDEAWLLAISAKGRLADTALRAGADDYLHRPFTRGELLARARAGMRAAQQRADDKLVRALMIHVPGAIYRSAWHDRYAIELISDEIERISGYPPQNFIASRRRTIMSIVHPDDREAVMRGVEEASARGEAFEFEYRIVRSDGEVRWVLDRGQPVPGPGGRLWMDGAIVDITERRAAEEALREQKIEAARTEELRASRVRIVQAADAARRKIERDLHDGAQQRLVSLALEVRLARSQVEKDPSKAAAFLERFGDELMEASAELRELARGIHPAVLTERGLAPAIASLAARAPVPVEVRGVPEEPLPRPVEAAVYFVTAEALTNVAKYAQADTASVVLSIDDGSVRLEIRDDGVGGADSSAGGGVAGLCDRVEALDGTIDIESPPGGGTAVRVQIPLKQ
jgi:PAS domain S-box-containing protein